MARVDRAGRRARDGLAPGPDADTRDAGARAAARVLDGYDLSPVLRGTGRSPRNRYFYYRSATLQAVRSGPFKLHFFTRPDGNDERPQRVDPPWLFDLDQDPGEEYDIAAQRPDVVAELRRMAGEHLRGVEPAEDQVAKRARRALAPSALRTRSCSHR